MIGSTPPPQSIYTVWLLEQSFDRKTGVMMIAGKNIIMNDRIM